MPRAPPASPSDPKPPSTFYFNPAPANKPPSPKERSMPRAPPAPPYKPKPSSSLSLTPPSKWPIPSARSISPSHQDGLNDLFEEDPPSPLHSDPLSVSALEPPPAYSPGPINYDSPVDHSGSPSPRIYHPQSPDSRFMAGPLSPPPYSRNDLQLFDDDQNVRTAPSPLGRRSRDPTSPHRTRTGGIRSGRKMNEGSD